MDDSEQELHRALTFVALGVANLERAPGKATGGAEGVHETPDGEPSDGKAPEAPDSAAVAAETTDPKASADATSTSLPGVVHEGKEYPFQTFPRRRLQMDSAPKHLSRHLIRYDRTMTVPQEDERGNNISEFSSTMPSQAAQVNRILRALFYDPKSRCAGNRGQLLDMTAHIGVDTLNTALAFPGAKMTAVEIDPLTAEVCRRNVRELGFEGRVDVITGDSVELSRSGGLTRADLANVDPPWGGPEYYKLDKYIPEMSGQPFTDVVASLLADGTALAVASKLPKNTDEEKFIEGVREKVPDARYYVWEIYKWRYPGGRYRRGAKATKGVSFKLYVVTADLHALDTKVKTADPLGPPPRGRGRGRGRGKAHGGAGGSWRR